METLSTVSNRDQCWASSPYKQIIRNDPIIYRFMNERRYSSDKRQPVVSLDRSPNADHSSTLSRDLASITIKLTTYEELVKLWLMLYDINRSSITRPLTSQPCSRLIALLVRRTQRYPIRGAIGTREQEIN